MLTFIGFLPAFIAFRVAMNTSPSNAFFKVYIPVLLCLPDYYRVITPGAPDPTFNQGVALVIFIVAMMRGGYKGYRFSHMDIVVCAYGFCVFNSELQASGYSDAQNLMFAMMFSVMAPYFMAMCSPMFWPSGGMSGLSSNGRKRMSASTRPSTRRKASSRPPRPSHRRPGRTRTGAATGSRWRSDR